MKQTANRMRSRPVSTRATLVGSSVVEMIGTCFIMGILFSITVPMFMVIARERRTSEQRQFALQHAANLLEQTAARKWSELEPGELALPEAEQGLQSVLPGLERSLLVKQTPDETTSRQVIASVRWRSDSGQPVSPLELSTWIYPTKEVR